MTRAASTPDRPALLARPPRPTPDAAFGEARRWFLKGKRLDISALAAELGISRVTLHRWVGTRDQLLTEVMWSLADRTLDVVLAELERLSITPRTPDLLGRFVALIVANPGVQRMHSEEPDVFLRLCTLSGSSFQRRLIARVAEVIELDRREGCLSVELSTDELAYAAVRLCESYAHSPAITGEPSDPEQGLRVARALLR
jgi:AcrR family transcriptional regulator